MHLQSNAPTTPRHNSSPGPVGKGRCPNTTATPYGIDDPAPSKDNGRHTRGGSAFTHPRPTNQPSRSNVEPLSIHTTISR